MLDHILTTLDGWTVLKVAAALIPAIMFVWIIATVTALHNRDVYFWGLGSTWATVIGCPTGLITASLSTWSQLNDPNAAPYYTLIWAGVGLYAVVFVYSLLYNYGATRSVTLALSTSMLQQLAVLGVILLFLRFSGNQANRGRRSLTRPLRNGTRMMGQRTLGR